MSKIKKSFLLIVTLSFMLAPFFANHASAACAIAIEINGTPYQACKGFDDLLDNLAQVNIPGFNYDKSTHTISLNGFNGALSGYCGGTCTEEIANTLPSIEITGDSIINHVLFKAGTTTATPIEEQPTEEEISYRESKDSNLLPNNNLTDCPKSALEQLTSSPIFYVIIAIAILAIVSLTIVIDRIISKNKATKSQVSSTETPQTPTFKE